MCEISPFPGCPMRSEMLDRHGSSTPQEPQRFKSPAFEEGNHGNRLIECLNAHFLLLYRVRPETANSLLSEPLFLAVSLLLRHR